MTSDLQAKGRAVSNPFDFIVPHAIFAPDASTIYPYFSASPDRALDARQIDRSEASGIEL
jgi:hypothetical protein